MYNERFSHLNKSLQNILFLLRFKWCKQKWICLSVYLFTASFPRKIEDENIINNQ